MKEVKDVEVRIRKMKWEKNLSIKSLFTFLHPHLIN
jgi:hypothetical protein